MTTSKWHPVTRTALGVARLRAEESARSDRLFDDPYAEVFLAATGVGSSTDAPTSRRGAGLSAWIVARTRFLDDLVAHACGEEGCVQVVILGAGLDSRALRLALPSGVVCFELDTEPLMAFKGEVIAGAGLRPACDLRLVAVDLADSWEPALLEAGFEPEDRTVWIAEGLLVYLRSDDRDALLRTAAILSPAGSRLGATVPAAGRRRQLAAQGGGDLWLSDGPEDPTRWLAGLGWAAELFDSRERLAAYGRATPGWDSGGWRPGRPALVSARRR